nr:ATP-binding protein [Parahaliea mediterranea]
MRRQLILVSLLLLTLPWAGCQFVREIEGALRQGQARALEATAQAVAASFADQPELLYPWPGRLAEPADTDHTLYARAAGAPIIVDGYADGWPEQWTGRFASGGGAQRAAFRYQAATRDEQLYLLLTVEDEEVVYDNPGLSPEPNGDRLLLQTWLHGKRQQYVIATAAPGSVRARPDGRRHPGADAQRIRGYWQDTRNGYTLELELPLAMTGGRLGLQVVNISRRAGSAPVMAGNIGPLDTAAPPWLVFSPTPLRAALDAFATPGRQLQVFDTAGWQLAQAAPATDSVGGGATGDGNGTFWLLQALYRRILASEDTPPLPRTAADGRLAATELERALRGAVDSRWYREPEGGSRTVLSAAAPVRAGGQTIGGVVVRQSSEQYLSLTDRAFGHLLGYSLLAIGLAALGLLTYASVLSWRIGRLSRAAGEVVDKGALQLERFPRSRARDEIGELSRRYADLLAELQAYNEYLRTLSRKLSHELRTPIAVIQSSLDNLEQEDTRDQRGVYVGRAREGLARLNRILTAMTEASRVEESVRGDPLIPLDLVPLLRDLLPAYQGAYPGHQIRLDCKVDSALVLASPDLLVQALDKLVDNAVSFSAEEAPVRIGLRAEDTHWELSVSNRGPALPASMQGQLFEAMVSVRENRASGGVHLGLGLYIVKLISEYLGGSATASDLADGSGVCVSLRLPPEKN